LKNLFPGGSKTRKDDPGKNGMKKKRGKEQTKANMQKALTTDAMSKMLNSRAFSRSSTIKGSYFLQGYKRDLTPCPQQWS